jgi:excisionase family DNA binding protein
MLNNVTLESLAEMLRSAVDEISGIKAHVAMILRQRTIKDYYTTKEVAELLGKKEYTVREWCRLGRVGAIKLGHGRGNEGEWRIPHEALECYQREGLLPPSRHAQWR